MKTTLHVDEDDQDYDVMNHRHHQGGNHSHNYDMQVIGRFLSYASRGDRVGLNMMLREQGTSPDVQDYDQRTAMHLAASEGHAPIVELLILYKANLNLKDRWQRTPLTDARLYGHRDICRILEVNGGKDYVNDHHHQHHDQSIAAVHSSPLLTVRHDQDSNEVKFDISELDTQQVSRVDQGVLGESMKVKWRGTWVVKTVIKSQLRRPVKIKLLSAKDDMLLRELRHPNILQFLGSVVDDEQVTLITEHLPKGNLDSILAEKIRLDLPVAIRFALDIARGMNYLHEHKPMPIVHNHLNLSNLLQDGGGHLKIGEYWVQMLYEQGQPNQGNGYKRRTIQAVHTDNDVSQFGFIFYQMLEGKQSMNNMDVGGTENQNAGGDNNELKFSVSRCPKRIKQLIERCVVSKTAKERPSFAGIIETLEEVSAYVKKVACPVC